MMPPLPTPSSLSFDSHCPSSARLAQANDRWSSPVARSSNSDESLATKEPNHMMERPRIFVDNRLGAEEVLVPGPTPTKVCDGQCHMGDPADSGMATSLSRLLTRVPHSRRARPTTGAVLVRADANESTYNPTADAAFLLNR